jgi:preprotein translocase subunit SecE
MLDNVKAAPGRAVDGVTGWFTGVREFFGEVRNELKRVTWPSRKEVYATTFVVILTSIFFGVYLWVVDLGLSAFINRIFRFFGAA